jgi:hypothetical protein
VAKIREYVVVEIDQLYDIVLIPAGFVGINHYQAAKAATEGARALRQGGIMIIVSENTDVDPIGGPGYKQALQLLKENGKDKFMEMISAPDWKMVPEQWQVQMWCKVLDVLGSEDHLYYCCLDIPLSDCRILPGHAAVELIADLAASGESKVAQMERMVERVVAEAIRRSGKSDPTILFLKDGPYGIPELVNG